MVNISIRINGDLSPNQKRDAGLVFCPPASLSDFANAFHEF